MDKTSRKSDLRPSPFCNLVQRLNEQQEDVEKEQQTTDYLSCRRWSSIDEVRRCGAYLAVLVQNPLHKAATVRCGRSHLNLDSKVTRDPRNVDLQRGHLEWRNRTQKAISACKLILQRASQRICRCVR